MMTMCGRWVIIVSTSHHAATASAGPTPPGGEVVHISYPYLAHTFFIGSLRYPLEPWVATLSTFHQTAMRRRQMPLTTLVVQDSWSSSCIHIIPYLCAY